MKLIAILFFCLLVSLPAKALDQQAEQFVKQALELGQYDADYVDAYLGPEQWAEIAKNKPRNKEDLSTAISALLSELNKITPTDKTVILRHQALFLKVRAMDTRMRMVVGEKFSFADEAKLIYDATLPDYSFATFDKVLKEIDELIPGDGDLASRVDRFRNTLVIPDELLDKVINLAISECKQRTLKHITLPTSEHFILEYVNGKSWSGYNWYQGSNVSLMQINLDFPVNIDRAIDLGCHEGYPGHHVWNVLVENILLKERNWIEHSIFPLFSPTALIGEGSANYGVNLAFPADEKIKYEREVLFPLAGLDPKKAATLDKLNQLTDKLSHATTATAQLYLDGKISNEEAVEQRRKYGLTSRKRAQQSVKFIEQYRSYVLNYNLGKDIVTEYIESQGDSQSSNWQAFERMLTEMPSASGMTVNP